MTHFGKVATNRKGCLLWPASNLPSDVKQALTKAEECEKKMLAAKSEEDRVFYDRIRGKWIGVADAGRLSNSLPLPAFSESR
jgi:hypothetical protein